VSKDKALRDHLLYLLGGGGAHADIKAFISDFPVDLVNERIENLPYTPWQVLEHMRIAQWDILEFSRNPRHVSPEFPAGYWPPADAAADVERWKKTIEACRENLDQMKNLVEDPSTDLFSRIPHGDGQTILREALLVADHNAYHLGALFVMKRILADKKQHGKNK
jgi:DinB family protein